MSEKVIKVTDRRMFTSDGKLREEYEHILTGEGKASEEGGGSQPAQAAPPEPAAAAPPPQVQAPMEPPAQAPPQAQEPAPPSEEGGGRGPGFMDLIGMLAEPASIHLGEAQRALAGGAASEARRSLQMARLHIDLLVVLKEKTEGNLSLPERSLLEDVLNQLRLGFVETNR